MNKNLAALTLSMFLSGCGFKGCNNLSGIFSNEERHHNGERLYENDKLVIYNVTIEVSVEKDPSTGQPFRAYMGFRGPHADIITMADPNHVDYAPLNAVPFVCDMTGPKIVCRLVAQDLNRPSITVK